MCLYACDETRHNEEENVARRFAMDNKSVSRRAIHVETRVKFPVTWKRTLENGIFKRKRLAGENYKEFGLISIKLETSYFPNLKHYI